MQFRGKFGDKMLSSLLRGVYAHSDADKELLFGCLPEISDNPGRPRQYIRPRVMLIIV